MVYSKSRSSSISQENQVGNDGGSRNKIFIACIKFLSFEKNVLARYLNSVWKMHFPAIYMIGKNFYPQTQPGVHSGESKRSEISFEFFMMQL